LYDAFLPHYYWTEVMECLRKLLLTGFVVFFYEGSGLQIFASMFISIIFVALYAKMEPYLMPSNNTFAVFVHFQVAFTLACTLMLRVNDNLSSSGKGTVNIDSDSLSYALLISNASVLLIGLILIGRACFNTSEGDFLDVGFDDDIQEVRSKDEEGEEKEQKELDIFFNKKDTISSKKSGEGNKKLDTQSPSPRDDDISNPSVSKKNSEETKKKKKKKKKSKRKKSDNEIEKLPSIGI